MASNDFDRIGRVSHRLVRPANIPQDNGDPGVRAAMDQVKRGETVPAAEVEAWIESWDTPNELPMPEPRHH